MITLEQNFHSREDMAAFVNQCDTLYWEQVECAIDRVLNTENLKFLTLSGPTCSGKTTTSMAIAKKMNDRGIHVKLISIDDFYHDRDNNLKTDGKSDFESVNAIDLKLFSECVQGIHEDRTVYIPTFNFQTGKRDGYTEYTRKAYDIILFEGIQAVYPEITKLFFKNDYLSIFVNVEQSVNVDGKIFAPQDIRLCRRLVRDSQFRSAPAYATLKMWDNVVKNENQNIFPNSNCDISIDTTLLYQFGVLKPYLTKLFETTEISNQYAFQTLKNLVHYHDHVQEIPAELVPQNSVFREFIGH